jgi:hypothetical protein
MLVLLLALALPIVIVVGWLDVHNHSTVNSWHRAQAVTLYCWNGAGVEAGERRIREARHAWSASRSDSISHWRPHGGRARSNPSPTVRAGTRWAVGERILMHHPIQATEVMVQGLVRDRRTGHRDGR